MQLRKLVIGGLVMGLAMSAGIAYASIPDSKGVIHACYKPTATPPKLPGKLRVIDSPTKSCVSPEVPLRWPTKGQLLYQNSTFFTGPYTSGQTVATFSGVPAGLMCVTGTASAYATTPQSFLILSFSNGTAPSGFGELFANEAGSHKSLVEHVASCATVPAGTYSYIGNGDSGTTSDGNDRGSLSVQVFAN